MPRLTSSAQAPDDQQVARVEDVSPEDIHRMSDEEIYQLLARLRANRQSPAMKTRATKTQAAQAREPTEPTETIIDEIEE
jgi:hypothetical protein